jgi:hypothetical protein
VSDERETLRETVEVRKDLKDELLRLESNLLAEQGPPPCPKLALVKGDDDAS